MTSFFLIGMLRKNTSWQQNLTNDRSIDASWFSLCTKITIIEIKKFPHVREPKFELRQSESYCVILRQTPMTNSQWVIICVSDSDNNYSKLLKFFKIIKKINSACTIKIKHFFVIKGRRLFARGSTRSGGYKVLHKTPVRFSSGFPVTPALRNLDHFVGQLFSYTMKEKLFTVFRLFAHKKRHTKMELDVDYLQKKVSFKVIGYHPRSKIA